MQDIKLSTLQQKIAARQDSFHDQKMEEHIEECGCIIQALGFSNIRMSTENEDQKQCTDLIAYDEDGNQKTFALRIRTVNYRCYNDFTVRVRENTISEIQKLWTSPVTHYIYAWQNTDGVLDRIYVIDMQKFKQSQTAITQLKRNYKSNYDGTGFNYISISRLNQLGIVIGKV